MGKVRKALVRLCAYTHLWRVIRSAIEERRLPASAKPGFSIALLGLFCPIFWIALFTGASKGELIFHACHSALVFLIGIGLMLIGFSQREQ